MRALRLFAVSSMIAAAGCVPAPRTKPKPAISPTTAPRGIVWVEYKSAEDGFRVNVPDAPRRTDQGGYGVHQVILPEKETAYTVHASPSSSLLGLASPELLLKSYQQRTIKRDFPNAELVSATDVRLGEVKGKEFVLKVEGYDIIRRVYATEQRMYLVTVSGKDLKPATPHVTPFFDSFAVTETKGK
ncbi:MAG: hypothetical protein ACOVT5_09235 [Armatimonadaceae bacterium]